MDSGQHLKGETLVVDSLGRLIELDDLSAQCLAVPASRALGKPIETVVKPDLAQAVAAARAGDTATWRGRAVKATLTERGTVIELEPAAHAPPAPSATLAEVSLVCTLEELRRLLEAAGPRIAISGSLSVQAGTSGQWVPIASWGDSPQASFGRLDCLALRTGLTAVTTKADPIHCRHWPAEDQVVCVPVHSKSQPMLVSLNGCEREAAEALATAILGRTSHPEWQG